MTSPVSVTKYINGIVDNYPVPMHELSAIGNYCQEKSKVKKGGKPLYDFEKRDSFVLRNMVLDLEEDGLIQFLQDNNIIEEHFDRIVIAFDKTLVYMKGMFFKRHTDGIVDTNHIGTLLIFPPKSLTNFEGGSLTTWSKCISADNKEWTCVFIALGKFHEVEQVINGTRVVFKYNVFGILPLPPSKKDSTHKKGEFTDDFCNGEETSSSEEIEDDFDTTSLFD